MRSLRTLLRPASLAYGAATNMRNRLFDAGLFRSVRVGCPVISIGNLTAGGNAKTPLTIFIVEQLKVRGFRPFVLSRGYGGSTVGPALVDGSDSARKVGDEPLLIHRRTGVPVVVGARRVEGARYALQHGLGDVAILDDGLQHRSIARDLNLISVACDSAEKIQAFRRGAVLPEGNFREARASGLARADAVIWANRTGADNFYQREIDELAAEIALTLPQFRAALSIEGAYSLLSGQQSQLKRAVAFCGIAGPEAFFSSLERCGIEIAARVSFRDHHFFTAAELQLIKDRSGGLPLVCTEKDAVRIEPQWRENIFELRTQMRVTPQEEFVRLMEGAIQNARREQHDGV